MNINNYDSIFKNDFFKSMDEEKIKILKNIVNNLKGKDVNEIFLDLIKFSRDLEIGREFSAEEKNAIINFAFQQLPDEDKHKALTILKLFNL